MRLATAQDRLHGGGAEVIAISIDDEVRQAGMAQRWGLPMVRFVSDPGGETYLQALDLYDPEERGGIALPGLLVVSPDGNETYRHVGRDFADRTSDDDLLAAVDALGLPAIQAPEWTYDVEVPDDLAGYYAPANLFPYMMGNMYAAIAIGNRMGDDHPEARALAREHRLMAKATTEALGAWRSHLA